MTRQLTTQNATITTAAVEVKTLTISGKQVTLAVFRQLKEEPLITEDGTLNGEPWGSVNYHPDKCSADAEHLHIVWQKGAELRRSNVTAVPDFDRVSPGGHQAGTHWYRSTAANRYLTALVYMGLRAGREPLLSPLPRGSNKFDTYMAKLELPAGLSETEEFPVIGTVPQATVDAADLCAAYRFAKAEIDRGLSDYERTTPPEWQAKVIAQRHATADHQRHKYDEAMGVLGVAVERCGGIVDMKCAYTAEIRAEEARRQRHRDAHAALAELPQLFIAV
ncbi:hypothetical protein [Streptomyces sp. B1I3]|uniref:hypothetical protein n=1 Tax=Streptomyces sp. B1I3 TaxID=3042264 RepID=UPI002784F2DD|nr:hypothetical protein [Streptomyces sp. B1I3]MDQ0792024.1 hypothetical protein [Streptomyces sp. B1I3]